MSDIVDGWGRGTWGQGAWNENIPVEVIGQNLTTVLNSVNVVATANIVVNVTGEELIHALESNVGVSAGGSVQVPVFENPLITNINGVNVLVDANVTLNSQNLTTALNSVTVLGTANVSLSGENLTTALGTVDPSPDVMLTGQQLTLNLNNVNIAIIQDAFVNVTGEQLITALSSVSIDLNTPVDLTGQSLTLALGNETAFTNVTVNIIGQSLTGTTGQLFVTAWAEVNTGQTINWTDVAA